MFRLIKLLIKAAVVLAVIYLAGQSFLDHMFEKNIGAKVRIGSIRLHVNPTEIEVKRIKIYNLKGFKEPHLAVLPEVFIRISIPDLLKGNTRIQLMRINLEEIRIERNAQNQVNLNELRKILDQKQAAQKNTAPSASSGAPRTAASSSGPKKSGAFIIDRAVFSLGKVIYADSSQKPVYHKEFAMNIREQALNNAADPLSLVQQVISAILSKVSLNLASAKLDQWGAQAGVGAGEMFQNAKKGLENLFN